MKAQFLFGERNVCMVSIHASGEKNGRKKQSESLGPVMRNIKVIIVCHWNRPIKGMLEREGESAFEIPNTNIQAG